MDIKPKDVVIKSWTSKPSKWVYQPPEGIELIHLPTGIVIREDSERSQHKNRNLAFEQLKKKLADYEE